MKKDFNSLIEETITNIREDRQQTSELLKDLIVYIGKGSDKHREVGQTLAKYLEVLQKSNEQLVKLTSIVKRKDDGDETLSENDRDSIFDELNQNPVKKVKK